MPHHLIRKLGRYARLSPDDETALGRLVRDAEWIGPDHDLLREGAAAKAVWAILEGWACAYKQLEDGAGRSPPISCPATCAGHRSSLRDSSTTRSAR